MLKNRMDRSLGGRTHPNPWDAAAGDGDLRWHAPLATYAGVGDCQKVAFNPCGQVIGQINEVQSCRQVIYRLLEEYVDAVGKAGRMLPEADRRDRASVRRPCATQFSPVPRAGRGTGRSACGWVPCRSGAVVPVRFLHFDRTGQVKYGIWVALILQVPPPVRRAGGPGS